MVAAQQVLDADYAERMQQYSGVAQWADAAGFGGLAESLAPAPIVMLDVEIECRFTFSKSTEREFSIRILNAAWVSRFQSTAFAQHSLRFTIKRAPILSNSAANSPI